MKKISDKEKDIANMLNEKRGDSYLDIYRETEFSGNGYLVTKQLEVYKYSWNLAFGSGNFKDIFDLSKFDKKIDYKELETYLIKDLEIVEKSYPNSDSEFEKYSEIVKLDNYVNEFENKLLYDKIIEKIKELLEEEI